jgi:AmmeMemoRadiSam system protein B
MNKDSIRHSAVAGSFYPLDTKSLLKEVSLFLEQAKPSVFPERMIGLISPHAGYAYSGGTAAYGYKLLKGRKFKRVIIFALSHRASFHGASIFIGAGYETPLGIVNVDRLLAEKILKASSIMTYNPLAHQMEHSLEVQLPFLQATLGSDFQLVPILFRNQDLETCRNVTSAVLSVLPKEDKESTLIVGSTDLYHGPDYQECVSQDQRLADTLIRFDEVDFEDKMSQGEIMACGPASIMATMMLSRCLGARKIEILHMTNSTDVTGQMSDYVVGYLSAVLY